MFPCDMLLEPCDMSWALPTRVEMSFFISVSRKEYRLVEQFFKLDRGLLPSPDLTRLQLTTPFCGSSIHE